MRKLIAVAVLAACAASPAAASAGRYAQPIDCAPGEPAYNGWHYGHLQAYGVACRNARTTADEYVYDFSTEGVIEPPRHWARCKDKEVGDGVWKGKCTRVKGDTPQKITFLFGNADVDWF
jgi:hypothetical protein